MEGIFTTKNTTTAKIMEKSFLYSTLQLRKALMEENSIISDIRMARGSNWWKIPRKFKMADIFKVENSIINDIIRDLRMEKDSHWWTIQKKIKMVDIFKAENSRINDISDQRVEKDFLWWTIPRKIKMAAIFIGSESSISDQTEPRLSAEPRKFLTVDNSSTIRGIRDQESFLC